MSQPTSIKIPENILGFLEIYMHNNKKKKKSDVIREACIWYLDNYSQIVDKQETCFQGRHQQVTVRFKDLEKIKYVKIAKGFEISFKEFVCKALYQFLVQFKITEQMEEIEKEAQKKISLDEEFKIDVLFVIEELTSLLDKYVEDESELKSIKKIIRKYKIIE